MDEHESIGEMLALAEELGLEVRQTKDWWKIGRDGAARVYVGKAADDRAREVQLSGFTLHVDGVEQISEKAARQGNRGNVRGRLRLGKRATAEERKRFRVAFDEALARLVSHANEAEAAPPAGDGTVEVRIDDRLFAFRGYGRLEAPLWFLGIEEGFGMRVQRNPQRVQEELDIRAGWAQVMDARDACETLGDRYWTRRRYTRVWRNAAKLTRAILHGAADWDDEDEAHEYVCLRLGRSGSEGETFLGEIYPLPAADDKHWPYESRWKKREIYHDALRAQRLGIWREAFERHRPRVVICYGAAVRDDARALFDLPPTKESLTSAVRGDSRIVFAPFIGFPCSDEKLDEVLAETLA